MAKQNTIEALPLFPNYCKKIGVVFILLSIIPVLIIHWQDIRLTVTGKEILKVATFNVFILGLGIIAWSKDKIEDELTIFIRLKSIALSFFYAVLYVVIKPVINLITDKSPSPLSAYQLIFTMLFSYLFMYYIQKWGR